MKAQRDIASFVLRFTQELWQDSQGEPHVEWRGHIRHVQGDEESRFTDVAEAMTFIQKSLMKLTVDSTAEGNQTYQDKVMRESYKLWERFAASYATMVVETMQQTAKQSEALKQQFGQTLEQMMRPWWLPVWSGSERQPEAPPGSHHDQAQLLDKLTKMEQQIAALTAKVQSLEETEQPQERAGRNAAPPQSEQKDQT